MKKLLETIYILTPESYVFHRNENICISVGGNEKASVPVHQVDSIVFFGKNTLSTSLLSFCSKNDISITFLSENGYYLGKLCGPVSGNVLLRKQQYQKTEDSEFSNRFVRDLLYCKIKNSKTVLLRAARNCIDITDKDDLMYGVQLLSTMADQLSECEDIDSMRGVEGAAANAYFSRFDCMLSSPAKFRFDTRSRRPPENEVNAVLSFLYTLMSHDISAALETFGLDPAAGYLHTLRPGRASLSLDFMEELRAPLCDRLTLALFNKGQLTAKDFDSESLAVYLNDRGRRTVIGQWRERKREEILHPFFKEKIPIGMIPYTQAMLFARVLRGDLDRYPPFVWR